MNFVKLEGTSESSTDMKSLVTAVWGYQIDCFRFAPMFRLCFESSSRENSDQSFFFLSNWTPTV